MKGINARIRITRLITAMVVIISVVLMVNLITPIVQDVQRKLQYGTHLVGAVYSEKTLPLIAHPTRLYYDKWDASSGYDGYFVHDGYRFSHGIGMYIPAKIFKEGQTGSTTLGFDLGGNYDQIYFKLCTDSEWSEYYGAGEYRVICSADGKVVLDTGFNDHTYSKDVKLRVSGVKEFLIELQEIRGPDGTLNVILGELEVNKRSK